EASLGRHREAADRLAGVLKLCRTHGLHPWVARILIERGRILLAFGDHAAGKASIVEGAQLAGALGMRALEARARSAMEGPRAPVARTPIASSLTLAAEGSLWRVRHQEREIHVRDSRGMQMLARLVGAPGERIHALVLAGNEEESLVQSD